MRPFNTLTAIACPLPVANVDTDQLIPARFLRRPRSENYGNFLLRDLRFETDDTPKPGCPLDEPAYKGSQILVARRNFGCGSSREGAVYALADFGIRTVIAPSFGDIFASNAVKNGVLPARVSEEDAERLLEASRLGADRPTAVDLDAQTITAGNLVVPFSIDPVWKKQLLNGWDDIDITLSETAAIERFCARDAAARPWMPPSVEPEG
jgi:3-isopropylmalate/(R)-2-methylmalate dehydratase small subunit